MPTHCTPPPAVTLTTEDGTNFIVYPGPEGAVFLERVRRSGRRGPKSIFQFDLQSLLGAISHASSSHTCPSPS